MVLQLQGLTRRGLLRATGAAAAGLACGTASAQSGGAGLLARLRAAKKVTIGIANQPPYGALNPDGSVTGLGPVITKLIMERLGVPNVEGLIGTYGELIPGMLAGRWDFVGVTITVTKPRCAQVAYSDPILFDGAAIVYSKGSVATAPTRIADIAKLGAALGVQQGGADLRAVLDAGVAQANVRQFTNDPAILDGLLAKRIDFAVMSHTPLHDLFAQRNIDMEVVYPLPDDPPKAAACAFRTQDTDLRDAYQQELAKMKASGEYLKIARQFGFDTTPEQMRITAEQACSTA